MTMRIHLLGFCLVLLTHTQAYAGAWLQPKGEGLLIAKLSVFSTDRFYDSSGNATDQPLFNKYEFQPYIEYGLWRNLTLGGSAYLQAVTQSGDTNQGLADPEFFVRTRLWHDDKSILSLQPLVKFSSAFATDASVRGGSVSTDFEVTLLYGRNLNLLSARDYLDVGAGYRFRNRGLSDQWRADAALGLGITDTLDLVPALRAQVAADLQKTTGLNNSGDLDYTLVKAELGANYRLNHNQALQATIYNHLAGVQTGGGTGFSIGFSQRF